jgi:hypothetical protein
MSHPDSLNPIPVPTARRGAARAADRDEKVSVLDPTPAQPADLDKAHTGGVAIEGTPGNFQVTRPSADVARSAVDLSERDRPEGEKAPVQYFRYVGDRERKFKMPIGQGRDGYSVTIRPGKVLSTLEYPLASLKTQGFLPQKEGRGGNLEPISADEARSN